MLRKYLTIIAAIVAVILSSCSGKSNANSNSADAASTDAGKNVLVAYFSATGTTRGAADMIAKATGGDLYEIAPATPYTEADLDWRNDHSRSSIEMHNPASRPQIKGETPDFSKYDVVFVGYPIWWDLAPTIINTFMESQDFADKTVIPFATSGGSAIDNSVKMLKEAYPAPDWKEGMLINDMSEEQVKEWTNKLGL